MQFNSNIETLMSMPVICCILHYACYDSVNFTDHVYCSMFHYMNIKAIYLKCTFLLLYSKKLDLIPSIMQK